MTQVYVNAGNAEFSWFTVEHGRFSVFGEGNPPSGAVTDLKNSQVIPGYVDSHCHILPTGLDLLKPNLNACSTPEEVLDVVRDAHATLPEGKWLHAVQYDQTKFATGAHLSRAELDQISEDRPILLRHVNGHASVANSAALVASGVTPDVPDPRGGEFVRDSNGSLSGVLLETAHERVTNEMPHPDLDEMVEAILRAAHAMREFGITCATDMMTGRWNLLTELEAYRIASETSPVRFRMFMQWSPVLGKRAFERSEIAARITEMDEARCKVCGVKIFADGAIGSATAAIYGEYTSSGNGMLIYDPDRLCQMVQMAHEAEYSVAVHTIGDRATDHVLDAFEATGEPSRHRAEHVMLLSNQQIERIAQLDVRVSLQPEFLAHFGHAYLRQLGPERAFHLKRARSLLDAGVNVSLSSDRPIVLGNPAVGIEAAVNRPGAFDPAENITVEEAETAYRAGGAHANFEPGAYGELKVGQFADFVIRSG